MADKIVKVTRFTTRSTVDRDTIVVSVFGDGVFIQDKLFSTTTYTTSQAEESVLFSADNFGILSQDNLIRYEKQEIQEEETSPPPPPPPVPVTETTEKQRYIPDTRLQDPKSTSGGEFVIKDTQEDYVGFYIEDFKGRFFAGRTVDENGSELEKRVDDPLAEKKVPNVVKYLPLLLGFLKPKLKPGDKEKGKTSRFILQNKNTKQISEIDKDTFYELENNLPGYTAVEVPWIIKGPAEDRIINGYPYEGAASKNKKAIQDLESQIPGISSFITDYSELVEEPAPIPKTKTQETVETEPQSLEDFRKANFDKRK